jgi:ABC-2 type transport system permease protein
MGLGLQYYPGRKKGGVMNRTTRAVMAVILVAIIIFCAITITQGIGKSMKIDITGQHLYTLSEGTRSILARLNQPITIKLFYSKTSAMKAPDAIRHYNDYYYFVRQVLEEYVAEGNGMVKLQIIDPRPFSDDEQEAMRYGLKKFNITEDESYFFGMIVRTPFGATRTIEFFTPDRQNFVEYDISYAIDSAISRKKTKIGVLSSLPVMGDQVTGYMAQMMRLQGRQPMPPWVFVRELQKRYDVQIISTDIEEIPGIDLLLIVHPKDLPEKTLFAIDQFLLKGGRAVILVDPYCLQDQPSPQARAQGVMPTQSSDLNRLLRTWGLEMPADTFAGDESLAMKVTLRQGESPQKLIGLLNLVPGDFNKDNIITADLNQVRIFFGGVLREIGKDTQIHLVPLLNTTDRGNSWKPDSPFELRGLDAKVLMRHFTPGSKPVYIAYMITGRFPSSFPDGVDVPVNSEGKKEEAGNPEKQQEPSETKHLSGLKEASSDAAVVVFADVDFISDPFAYQESFFGTTKVGDNSALFFNAIENLLGSTDLIAIRSRGNYQRPFTLVDKIEREAESETAQEEARINAQIEEFQKELSRVVSDARKKGERVIDASELAGAKADLELKIHEAKVRLRQVQNKRRERIERLGLTLRNMNMLLAPVVILIFAIILGIHRSRVRRRYIRNHKSD